MVEAGRTEAGRTGVRVATTEEVVVVEGVTGIVFQLIRNLSQNLLHITYLLCCNLTSLIIHYAVIAGMKVTEMVIFVAVEDVREQTDKCHLELPVTARLGTSYSVMHEFLVKTRYFYQ